MCPSVLAPASRHMQEDTVNTCCTNSAHCRLEHGSRCFPNASVSVSVTTPVFLPCTRTAPPPPKIFQYVWNANKASLGRSCSALVKYLVWKLFQHLNEHVSFCCSIKPRQKKISTKDLSSARRSSSRTRHEAGVRALDCLRKLKACQKLFSFSFRK